MSYQMKARSEFVTVNRLVPGYKDALELAEDGEQDALSSYGAISRQVVAPFSEIVNRLLAGC